MKKKTITLTLDEWNRVFMGCKNYYYPEWEADEEPEEEKKYWEAVNKLEEKLKK